MNSIVKKLIGNSTIMRNSITLSYYSTTLSCANVSRENLTNYKLASNDEKYAAQVMPSYTGNYFQSYFKDIERSCNKMDLNEAVDRFYKLYRTVKANKDLEGIEFTDYKGFEELCKVILKDARFLEMQEVVDLITTLKILNIPHSSMLLKTLFQLVLANLNILNVRQILKLHKIFINSNDDSTLVQSITLGLKHIFQEQALVELNSGHNLLLTSLAFSNINDNKVVKNHIIQILIENSTSLAMHNIGTVFISLSNEQGKILKQLLSIIKRFIKTNIQSMNQENIERILFYISKQRVGLFDDEINMLINHMVGGTSTLQEKLYALKHLNMLRFSSTLLLDSISCEILDDSNSLSTKNIDSIITLIQGFAMSDYKPHGWKTIAQGLENYINEMPNWSIQQLHNSIFQLLSLDYYSPALLGMIFRVYNTSLNTTLLQSLKQAFKLHWCVKLLYPEYEGEMLSQDILKRTVDNQANTVVVKRPFRYLQEAIVKVVNGDAYVMSKLKSRVIRTVDFVVAMRPDGSFVDLSNHNVTFVEELESIPDCNKILIYAFPSIAYCSNTRKLFSTVNMQLRAVEKLPGFHTIVINPFTWMNLSPDAKIDRLQIAINSKCPKV